MAWPTASSRITRAFPRRVARVASRIRHRLPVYERYPFVPMARVRRLVSLPPLELNADTARFRAGLLRAALAVKTFRLELSGVHRVFNAAVYRFYRHGSRPPNETDVPFATSASLPDTPTDLFPSPALYYVAVSYFDGVHDSGFLPVGPNGETFFRFVAATGQSSGGGASDPPATPTEWSLSNVGGGVVQVRGLYVQFGSLRAESWVINYTVDGSEPRESSTTTTFPATILSVMGSATLELLEQNLPTQSHGTEIKVRVQTRRGNTAYSERSIVRSIIAEATGGAPPN